MSEAIEDLAGPSTRHRPRPLDLVPIDLDAVPFASNALEWSADGVLAAATTDSVHILTPQFMTASGGPMPIYDGLANEGNSDQDDDTQDQGDNRFATETGARKQFGGSGRRILVGYPRLDHTINQPLYQEWAAHHPGDDQGQWQADAPKISAGSGSISGSGSTMNSVVSIAWSPSGVGYNERCVLGVLTASGMLIIYGDPLDGGERDDASTSSSGQRVSGNRNSYDTSRWEVLWAVGERTAVPGQKKPGECITSFAWTNACDAIVEKTPTLAAAYHRAETKALLVYQTDRRDIVVLDVSHSRYIDGRVTWKVAEMERIKAAAGAHLTGQWTRPGAPSVTDFSFVPHSTPFGLRCSPWMVEKVPLGPDLQPESLLTCIIGYTALHYVGFRRLSLVLRPDVSSGRRTIFIDTKDISGFCAFMGANAVLRFEDCLWRVDDDLQTGVPKKRSQCRGVVATPMTLKAFEFEFTAYDPNLVAQATGAPDAHIVFTEGICAATEPSQAEWHTNPISG
ncbi:hypothetical protein SPBR_08382 [Sporothrix brasiliensis 5110]|uniref:Transcription factor IIIC 90kDa subunit N-terminal domain-containing protein n=1 Tax=Sporothrix brasiliensis 5110 TaxID=1398154 RepID=A0A0C2IN01_9PEZI|nr:uncharacterized protein SPBR_08382 [Sporothrix brasiliensis 5110]KIH86362.1 hypothetical protein SPBR_08382 [Sporothrix brasiliensis 5110]